MEVLETLSEALLLELQRRRAALGWVTRGVMDARAALSKVDVGWSGFMVSVCLWMCCSGCQSCDGRLKSFAVRTSAVVSC